MLLICGLSAVRSCRATPVGNSVLRSSLRVLNTQRSIYAPPGSNNCYLHLQFVAMLRRRRKALFILLLLAVSTPFFSERTLTEQTRPREPPDLRADPPNHERAQQLTSLLLTPTFFFHLFWITGLSVVSVIVLLDILLKLVYVICSQGVKYVTPESLPAKSVISRYYDYTYAEHILIVHVIMIIIRNL